MEGTTKKERSDLGKKAAAARWSGDVKDATHGAEDRPLKIGDIEIGCYVLEDERRVITQTGMVRALGMVKGGSSHRGGTRLLQFISGDAFKAHVPQSVLAGTQISRFFFSITAS